MTASNSNNIQYKGVPINFYPPHNQPQARDDNPMARICGKGAF